MSVPSVVAGEPAPSLIARCARSPSSSRKVDNRTLFYGNNVLWKTIDGGINWTQVSPDLTRETWSVPKNVGTYAPRVQNTKRGGIGAQVIYTIGPSYKDLNRIWIGTDDGVIATTADGGLHWANVTPPGVTDFMKVFTIDPGRFDPLTAYAAVNTLRLDDMNPHIYRTHDGGKTWKEIVSGIPGGAPVSVVREDPKRKGLLFAGSETQVYVSFDDGDHWQSLRLNMAASSVRDLVIKDDDVVVGTHGRGIWILDNITPLRQISAATAQQDAVLFKPQNAWRVRWNTNTDTPLPPDEPTAPNPPEGAIIDYYLKSAASGPVTLEILDGTTVLRKYTSDDEVFRPNPATTTIPMYWYREPIVLGTTAGMHRFTWDVHYQPVDGVNRVGGPTLPIAAVGHNTCAGSVDALGQSWLVHRAIDGERQELHRADRGEAGSAREDSRASHAADLHAVARRVRRCGGGAASRGAGPGDSRSGLGAASIHARVVGSHRRVRQEGRGHRWCGRRGWRSWAGRRPEEAEDAEEDRQPRPAKHSPAPVGRCQVS
jgi:hypothetical protein